MNTTESDIQTLLKDAKIASREQNKQVVECLIDSLIHYIDARTGDGLNDPFTLSEEVHRIRRTYYARLQDSPKHKARIELDYITAIAAHTDHVISGINQKQKERKAKQLAGNQTSIF